MKDLRQRIAKLKEKWPSGVAPTTDWMSDFMGKASTWGIWQDEDTPDLKKLGSDVTLIHKIY